MLTLYVGCCLANCVITKMISIGLLLCSGLGLPLLETNQWRKASLLKAYINYIARSLSYDNSR